MIRYHDWHDRLSAYLDSVAETPFEWGAHDCALFASNAVQRMTGTDIAEAFRGKYNSYTTSLVALREHGAGTLLKTVKSQMGAPKSPHLAKRGDLVMLNAKTMGVCVGAYSWFVAEIGGGEGLIALPTSTCAYAFSVPFDFEAQP